MNLRLPVLFLVSCACVLAQEIPRAGRVVEAPAAPAAADVVVSQSGQFRTTEGNAELRGTVTMIAEEAKNELLRLTGEKDEWKVPVTIRLHGKHGDPLPPRTVLLSLLEVEGVSELRVDLHLSRGIEHEPFKRAVTMALIYERALRGNLHKDSDRPLVVPPWLADGLREATAWRLNQSDRRLYEAVFKTGLFKMNDLLDMDEAAYKEMDGATRAAFRVSSGALVMALLEQPQGKDGFRAFLTEVSAFEGEMPVLMRKHFPEMNLSETSLAKWWSLQLANKGGMSILTDVLTIQKTEEALAAALVLHFRNAEGILQQKPLAEWTEVAHLQPQERVAAVRMAEDALVRLSYRCFPSYRPLLKEYQQVLGLIGKNQTKDLDARLAGLAETRKTMIARATRARDYLDWYEITRARKTSGEFEDYLKLKERLKSQSMRRKDGISEYLDRMDRIFYREEKKSPFGAPKPAGKGLEMLPP